MLSVIRRPVFNTRFLSTLVKSMEKHEVVPDVIDVAPQEVAEVNKLSINLRNNPPNLSLLRLRIPQEQRWTRVTF